MELARARILELFGKLDDRLQREGLFGEIAVVGGAALCLLYNERVSTKDVDAIFEPTAKIRQLVKEIADEEELPPDWLNDAAKGFFAPHPGPKDETMHEGKGLRVWVPNPEYLFAMKALASRADTKDQADLRLLIQKIPVSTLERAIELLHHYYPKERVSQKTYDFLEELFEK